MDERRKHARAASKASPLIVWLVLDDGSRQMGVIDDHGGGGACIELNGVVTEITAGDVVGLECDAQPDETSGEIIPHKGRIVWVTGRHLGVQFLTPGTDAD